MVLVLKIVNCVFFASAVADVLGMRTVHGRSNERWSNEEWSLRVSWKKDVINGLGGMLAG